VANLESQDMLRTKIFINTSNLQKGGALQVAASFIYECVKYPEFDFIVVLGKASKFCVEIGDFVDFPNIVFHTVDLHPSHSLSNFLNFRKELGRLEKKHSPNCVISVFGPCYWKPRSEHIIGFANGYYLYEDSPFFRKRNQNLSLKYRFKKFLQIKLLKYEANKFWLETEDARYRFIDLFRINPTDVVVATNTASNFFYSPVLTDLTLPRNDKKRILYVSSYYPHKNFEIIPRVYELLLEKGYDVEFIITISDVEYSKNTLLNKCLGIRNMGFVDPRSCPSLYLQSDIVFVPSLLETFTANYPEAMISKKPIVTSDLPFARAICGNAALYYRFDSPNEAADKIILLIKQKNLSEKLIANGLKRLSSFDTPESRFKKILNNILCTF
jgi:glycosyltransferase involved in cell wall biosynthesis